MAFDPVMLQTLDIRLPPKRTRKLARSFPWVKRFFNPSAFGFERRFGVTVKDSSR
jgi:hypothetical protein